MKLIHGDCLEIMKGIPDESVDMILCDLPYGTSGCTSSWDKVIPLDKLWVEYKRLIKPEGAIVLFAQQPFTSKLILSNVEMYKYNWVWKKDNATNFLNSHYQPMKVTEDICVFSKSASSFSKKGNMNYFPQMKKGKPYSCKNSVQRRTNSVIRSEIKSVVTDNNGTRMPTNILEFSRDKEKFHPTQKPVKLLEYLIKTYTSERGGVILDNCMGSGSCGIAALNTGRDFIGIEKDDKFFHIANDRLQKHQQLIL